MPQKKILSRIVTAPVLVLFVFALLQLTGLIDTALLTRENEYAAVILLQILIFITPAVAFTVLSGENISSLKIRPIGPGHILIIISSVVMLASGSIILNVANTGYEYLESSFDLYGIFISKSGDGAGLAIYHILAYAVLPAICEEYVFRGVLRFEYEKKGIITAIFMPSLFFALLHFEPGLFLTHFFAGIVLSLIFYACRSLVAPIVVHFCYNLICLFGIKILQTLYDLGGELLFNYICGGAFLLSAFLFCAEASRLYRVYAASNYPSDYGILKKDPTDASKAHGAAALIGARHPYISSFLKSVFSPAALACYVFYAVVVLF